MTLLISERTHAVKDTSSAFDRLLLALYYSVLTYALLVLVGWLLGYNRGRIVRAYHHEQSIGKLFVFGFVAILVIPSFIATVSRIWLSSGIRRRFIALSHINPSHRTPTAWDHFFEQQEEAFLRATLTDGRVIGGYYGPGSFATYGQEGRDIFVSVQWELDDEAWFKQPADASLGIWLSKDSIVSLEVYAVKRDE